MTSLSQLRFFATPEHDCSYLEGKQAVTLFADPLARIDTRLYTNLLAAGFRRSGNHIYRPHCPNCAACISVRILVDDFQPRRIHRRIYAKNQNLSWQAREPRATGEYFTLYDRYISQRHADGDMYPAELDQFSSFLVDGRPEAMFYEMRDSNKLLGVAVADTLDDGLSAIYTFFDPDYEKHSLGTLAILKLIDQCRKMNLNYLYVGYWIEECRKMNYKTEFKPLQIYYHNQWLRVTD